MLSDSFVSLQTLKANTRMYGCQIQWYFCVASICHMHGELMSRELIVTGFTAKYRDAFVEELRHRDVLL